MERGKKHVIEGRFYTSHSEDGNSHKIQATEEGEKAG
jgi:hypothetical protein